MKPPVVTRRDAMRLGLGAAAAAALPGRVAAAEQLRTSDLIDGAPAAGSLKGARGVSRADTTLHLDANVNAYGPSPRAIAAVHDASGQVSRIGGIDALRNAIAAHHRVPPAQVVVGAGAGEILRMAVRAFTAPNAPLVTARPGYGVIARYAEREGTRVHAVPLTADWAHDLDRMLALASAGAGLVYICNPHNPTGSLTRRRDLERFVGLLPPSAHVVIDEAYHDYVDLSSDYRSFVDHAVNDSRILVIRSFSKVHGLAGLRVGYALGSAQTAAAVARHAIDDAVSGVAAHAALAALGDAGHVERSRTLNINDRQEFLNQANARMLRCIDSQTNFVMMGTEHPVGTSVERMSAEAVVDHFARHGIVLPKPFAPLDEYVRVSLGTADAMREFWRVWDLMPHHM